eukprot:269097-Chlamydomonas_euryale.AAC.2
MLTHRHTRAQKEGRSDSCVHTPLCFAAGPPAAGPPTQALMPFEVPGRAGVRSLTPYSASELDDALRRCGRADVFGGGGG